MDNKERELLQSQQEQYEKQFGSPMPDAWQECKYCGRPFGEHYGRECPVCECQHAIAVWNSEPKNNPDRVNWLSANVREIFNEINRYYQEGELWYSLQCKTCGRIIHVPA